MLVIGLTILEDIDTWLGGFPALLAIVVGVPLMLFGADWLVNGAVTIARRLGVSVLLIGLTIVAAGTSAPELAVNIIAALSGNGELSFGNVIGSNIANIGLVLAVGAILAPMAVNSRVITSEIPWLVVVSIATFALGFIPWTKTSVEGSGGAMLHGYSRLDGLLMLLGFVTVSWLWYRSSRLEAVDPLTREVEEVAEAGKDRSTLVAALMFLVGLVALMIGGKLTESGAVRIAFVLGLSEAIIGMTIVAVATSLPELLTVIVACRKGHTDLAVGNVVGSNLFNILLVLGTTAMIADVPMPPGIGYQDLSAMLFMTILLWLFAATQRRVTRGEGLSLLILYVLYVGWGVARELIIAAD